jgi:transposase
MSVKKMKKMSVKRTYHTSEFKKKVVLDALKEKSTIEELSQKYSIHPSTISDWKSSILDKFDLLFQKESNTSISFDKERDMLYSKIGQLNIEIDFLKKKL